MKKMYFFMYCLAGLAFLTGCEWTQPVLVKTIDMVPEHFGNPISFVGRMIVSETKNFAFEMDGLVKNVRYEIGDTVTPGMLLAEMDTALLEAARWNAESALKGHASQLEQLNRRLRLADQKKEAGLISSKDHDDLVVQFESLGAKQRILEREMQEATRKLNQASLRSTVSGTVFQRDVQPGDFVHAGKTLFSIAPLGALKAQLQIDARQGAFLTIGSVASVKFEGRNPSSPGVTIKGRLEKKKAISEEQVECLLDLEIKTELSPFQKLEATFRVFDPENPIFMIPTKAFTQTDTSHGYVFIYDAALEKVQKRTVQILSKQDSEVKVLGLSKGEAVVMEASKRPLKNGQKAKMVK